MELLIILITCLIMLAFIAGVIKFNFKNIKLIQKIGRDRNLNNITNSLPNNNQICSQMLKMLNNKNVKIKQVERGGASLYIVATNTIIISNISNTFTRVQTIAHECIHSTQSRRLLWSNYIFSNIYLLTFYTISILTLFNKLPYTNIFTIVLIFMSFTLFFIRSYLETDAMTRAPYLAEKYLRHDENSIRDADIDMILENYKKLNSIGIIFTNFQLLVSYILKICVFCILSLI